MVDIVEGKVCKIRYVDYGWLIIDLDDYVVSEFVIDCMGVLLFFGELMFLVLFDDLFYIYLVIVINW